MMAGFDTTSRNLSSSNLRSPAREDKIYPRLGNAAIKLECNIIKTTK